MAGQEVRLISRILTTQDMRLAVKSGLSEEDFLTAEGQQWWRYLHRLFSARETFGQTPSLGFFQTVFPTFDYLNDSTPLEILIQETKRNCQMADCRMTLEDIQAALDEEDLDSAVDLMQKYQQTWQTRAGNTDLSLAKGSGLLREQYQNVKEARGLLGLPWPWDPINDETLGMQAGQLIVLYARPKSMKTFLAMYIGIHAYLHGNARVLFFSREMSRDQLLRRAASFIAKVDYSDIKKATLTDVSEARLFSALTDLEDHEARDDGSKPIFMISTDAGAKGGRISTETIKARAKEMGATLVIIDAIYKLTDARTKARDSEWRSQANILQDSKDMAVDLGVPVIAVTQANRKASTNAAKVNTDEVAYTDAGAQEADILCRILKRIDPATGKPELILVWPATRDEDLKPLVIGGCPGYDFALRRYGLSEKEIADAAAQEDAGEADGETKKKPGGGSTGNGRQRTPIAMGRRSARQ